MYTNIHNILIQNTFFNFDSMKGSPDTTTDHIKAPVQPLKSSQCSIDKVRGEENEDPDCAKPTLPDDIGLAYSSSSETGETSGLGDRTGSESGETGRYAYPENNTSPQVNSWEMTNSPESAGTGATGETGETSGLGDQTGSESGETGRYAYPENNTSPQVNSWEIPNRPNSGESASSIASENKMSPLESSGTLLGGDER